MKNVDRITYLLSIAGIIASVFIGVRFAREGKPLLDIVSAIGSIASLIGLPIAILQIKSVKDMTAATRTAVEDTKAQLDLNLSISDLSKAIKLAEQIQVYLGHQKYEMAHTRLQELRALLVHFRGNTTFVKQTNQEEYANRLKDIGIHIINLYDAVFKERVIRIAVINRTLESVIEMLIAFEHKLRFMEAGNDS